MVLAHPCGKRRWRCGEMRQRSDGGKGREGVQGRRTIGLDTACRWRPLAVRRRSLCRPGGYADSTRGVPPSQGRASVFIAGCARSSSCSLLAASCGWLRFALAALSQPSRGHSGHLEKRSCCARRERGIFSSPGLSLSLRRASFPA